MTGSSRQGKVDSKAAQPDAAETGRELVRLTLAHQAGGPLEAVGLARELARSVEEGLALTVAQARDAGHTWAEIGQVLGTSRQAAFQRFGQPIDPRTGRPMTPALPNAGDRAGQLLDDLAAGRWPEVCRRFGPAVAARLDAQRLASAWAQVIGTVGEYGRCAEPSVYQAGDYTVVDTPLLFEAGERIMRVSYGRDGRVAGLFFLPRPAAEDPPRRPAGHDRNQP